MEMKKGSDDKEAPRLLSDTDMKRVIDEVITNCGSEGTLKISVGSTWRGSQRWARNRASMTSDERQCVVRIHRNIPGSGPSEGNTIVSTNQIDSTSLKAAAAYAEYYSNRFAHNREIDMLLQQPVWNSKGRNVWSDNTFNRSYDENALTVVNVTKRSEAAGFLSAGYIECVGSNMVIFERDQWGRESSMQGEVTAGQCSITVRHSKGSGSGWAGNSTFDWDRIDAASIADKAFDKCLKSINPVRIEPGRYQTILEPQAAYFFADALLSNISRESPESAGHGPFYLGMDFALQRRRSKLGLKVVDERISLYHDPVDSMVGTHVSEGVDKVTWIKNGILTELSRHYHRRLNEHADQNPVIPRSSFRMDGTDATIDDMIRSMKRGLLVTRVVNPEIVDRASVLYSGFTRDGLWLVEEGKITKAVRNFRWTESPFFVFNNIEEIGAAVPVFSPFVALSLSGGFHNSITQVVVPPIKVNDFSFSSTIDAI